jgi:uncharacterized iron-regulated membrane protein
MSPTKTIQTWFQVHKWTSLICTLFLLMLCVTGLPLIFYEEIDHALARDLPIQPMPENTPKASLDRLVETGLKQHPKKVIRYFFWDEHEPHTAILGLSDSVNAPPDNYYNLIMDNRTAQILDEPKSQEGFLYIMLRLHVDMFAGIGGKLFLGLMGLLFVAAIVSGLMLYGPIMRRFDFGMIRTRKSPRLKWLDLHNLLGVVALAWAIVVGLTGVINTLSDVVVALWQQGQLAEMVAPYQNKPRLTGKLSSLEEAVQTARQAAPGMEPSLVAYPGTPYSSKHHYAVFMKGTTPLTERLIKPALIDAQTGQLTDMREMPWYVKALFLSQPLHFGDYGGIPLKIIWALFDIITIVVLVSGLYLWIARIKATKAQLARLGQKEKQPEILTIQLQEGIES